jgi:hypothetical protein
MRMFARSIRWWDKRRLSDESVVVILAAKRYFRYSRRGKGPVTEGSVGAGTVPSFRIQGWIGTSSAVPRDRVVWWLYCQSCPVELRWV